MKGKEHWRSIEDYLRDRGWLDIQGTQWAKRASLPPIFSTFDAFVVQLTADLSEDEGGYKVAGLSLERQ